MKKLNIIDSIDRAHTDYQIHEGERIAALMRSNGFECSLDQAVILWSRYSRRNFANWLSVPTSDELLFEIVIAQVHYIEIESVYYRKGEDAL